MFFFFSFFFLFFNDLFENSIFLPQKKNSLQKKINFIFILLFKHFAPFFSSFSFEFYFYIFLILFFYSQKTISFSVMMFFSFFFSFFLSFF